MNTNKNVIGLTLAFIMIASIFAVLPAAAEDKTISPEADNPLMILEDHPEISSSLRVYGEDDMGPWDGYDGKGQFVYPNYWDPFDPTALQKDVLTFNPGIFLSEDFDYSLEANGEDAHQKAFLRLWYEPDHIYTKPEYERATIEVETTYMLIDEQDWIPTHGVADDMQFVFPIAEQNESLPLPPGVGTGTGLALIENIGSDPDLDNLVTLTYVAENEYIYPYNKTTNGTIRIQKGYVMTSGDKVQFLDHKLQFNYIVLRDGVEFAKVTVWYAGNIDDDSKVRLLLGQFDDGTPDDADAVTWFKRHNTRISAPERPTGTWFAQFGGAIGSDQAEIFVGKELAAGDTFYVNAVRYDVPAVEVLDTDGISGPPPDYNYADSFKYITLRTPLPKDTVSKLVPDDGKASSQWIDTIAVNETIPLLPPFNGNYHMIDDINVVLWEPTENSDEWPCGVYDGPDSIGEEYWPWAERYLTMQEEEILTEEWCDEPKPVGENWMDYFDVVKIDDGIDPPLLDWIAYDPSQRVVDATALEFCYIEEASECEFTTDLLEILNETFYPDDVPDEDFIGWDIVTRPNQYTEFALPPRPDVPTPPWNKTGDYLLTSSFLAPNSINRSDIIRPSQGIPRVSFAYDVEEEDDALGLVDPMGDAQDLYVNTWNNLTTVRVYGEDDIGPYPEYRDNGTFYYLNYRDPFNPAAIRKDSITFNPAIVQDYDDLIDNARMYADGLDIDLKKYLRIWYEPDHVYSKPIYKYPTIEVETTYLLIDSQDKLPMSGGAGQTAFAFPIAADRGTDQQGLEYFENPNSDPDAPFLVSLAYVNGTVEPYNKTVYDNATIRLEKTYLLHPGETVQFLDHSLTYFNYTSVNGTMYAKVEVAYEGNSYAETAYRLTLGRYQDGTPDDPLGDTFIARHPLADPAFNFGEPEHPGRTWYARWEGYQGAGNWSEITVGKELSAGDTFYVDGVRYDVAAIEVLDTGNDTYADHFKYITLRTPLPKLDGVFIRSDRLDSRGNLLDDGMPGISSQQIVPIPPETTIPLNPPFNMIHRIVDDIDTGMEEGDVESRIISWYDPLEIMWVEEAIEPRYSTNLLEILNETGLGTPAMAETWTKYDVITRPDQYTAFVLPGDIARYDYENQTWAEPWKNLHNDYLVTTSFLAPNSLNYSDLMDLSYPYPRAAFRVDGIEKTGKYINEILEEAPMPNNSAPTVVITVNATEVAGCDWVEVCTDGTTDDATWPLRIKVAWGDGTVSVEEVMPDASTPVCFYHQYMTEGLYDLTVTARDRYNAVGVNDTEQVDVNSTCAVLTFKPGWNAFSTPLDGVTLDEALGGYGGFGIAYYWDAAGQDWVSIGPTDPLDPTLGYFIHKDSLGTVTVVITGTPAVVADPTPIGAWQLVGVGSVPKELSYWAYWWDPLANGYLNTKTLLPGRGYFVSV